MDGEQVRVEERLAQLEDTCARLLAERVRWRRRIGLVLGLGCLVGAMGAAATAPRVLEAEHFVLRDGQGRMSAALAIRPDGTPGLGLFDENGDVTRSVEDLAGARPEPAPARAPLEAH